MQLSIVWWLRHRLSLYATFKKQVQNQWEALKSQFKWTSALNYDLNVELTFCDQHQKNQKQSSKKPNKNSVWQIWRISGKKKYKKDSFTEKKKKEGMEQSEMLVTASEGLAATEKG